VGFGQKLFKLDDHTICTIAGWYSDPSVEIKPDNSSEPSYPAFLTVPALIEAMGPEVSQGFPTIEGKLAAVTQAFQYALLTQARIDELSGLAPSTSKSEITLAGYNPGGSLKILRADLDPTIENGQITQYSVTPYPELDVPGPAGFVPVFRGIDAVAQSVLDGRDHGSSTDPILQLFSESIVTHRVGELSLDDLEMIAKKLEWRTAEQFPSVVGGEREVAILSGGRVSRFEPLTGETRKLPASLFMVIRGVHFMPGTVANPPTEPFMQMDPASDQGALLDGVTLTSFAQSLDNLVVFDSSFVSCRLTYSGSHRSIFYKTNEVKDSVLVLLPGADINSNFVKQIKNDFPGLRIDDETRAR
jgi:hypothetical protein